MRNLWTTLAVGVLALALLAGCGDGEESGNATGAGNSSAGNTDSGNTGGATADGSSDVEQAGFVKQANAICEANRKRVLVGIQAAVTKAKKIPGAADSANLIVPILVSSMQEQIDDLRALAAPDGDQDQVEALLDAYQAWVNKAESNPEEIVSSSDIYNEARSLASDNGLAVCAKGPLDP